MADLPKDTAYLATGNWRQDPMTQQPDTKPGPYYVTAIDGGRVYLMAGPYEAHADALADVTRARDIANEHDRRAWFMSWGTSRIEGSDRIGTLNRHGLI